MIELPLAIVGAGAIARLAHAPALEANASFALAACVSDGAGLPGVPCFPTLGALLADGPPVRALAICTPPQVRAAIAHAGLAAGLHMLLEKPPAATLAACAALAEAARRADVTLLAAWHSRFAAGVAPARAWLAARRITAGRVVWREDVRTFHPGQTWLWQPGGLGVFDSGINALSVLTEICPDPLVVRAAHFTVPDNAATPIAANLTLDTDGAAIEAELDFRHTGAPVWSILLETDGGTLRLDAGGEHLQMPHDTPRPPAGLGEYDLLYRHFADLIARRASDCDAAPLRLVADAFLLARHTPTTAFTP